MKRTRIPARAGELASEVVQQVVAGIGTPRWAAHALQALRGQLPTTFCTLFVAGPQGRIEAVSAASTYGTAAERTAALYVERRHDRQDPHMQWLAQRQRPRQAQLWLGHHRADELQDAAYRQACYDSVGIHERASVLWLSPAGARGAVSFYRHLTQPPFGEADFSVLRAHAPLLAEAAAAHVRALAGTPSSPARPADASGLLGLSLREREVIHLLRQGATAKDAARSLGIAPTTLRTLQYRAFRKLGIRTLRELWRAPASQGDTSA